MKVKEALPFLAVLGRVALMMTIISIFVWNGVKGHWILLDTDMGTDDIFALSYLLKLNSSQINLQAVTISTNAWSDAGHAVNQVYDILDMMGRDDITVGLGGEGGILPDSTILPYVAGHLPMIDQHIVDTCKLFLWVREGVWTLTQIMGFRRASYHSKTPRFNLERNGVHRGHVQTSQERKGQMPGWLYKRS